MSRPIVAVLFGGFSGEAAVSQASAMNVFYTIDQEKFEPYLVELDSDANWWLHHDGFRILRHHDVSKLQFVTHLAQEINFELVVNMIHGKPGESGELQQYLKLISLPYTGSGPTTMQQTFNKHVCQTILRENNFQVAPHYTHKGEVNEHTCQKIRKLLGSKALFVKPNSGGSSLGSGIARNDADLVRNICHALEYDDQVIIEPYLAGQEFSVGVIEYNDAIIALPITEIYSNNAFFDYNAKYEGACNEITPAKIDDHLTSKLQSIAVSVFELFKCRNMMRMEFIYSDHELYILDINTIPGFTDASILPQQIQAADVRPDDFVNQMIQSVLI